MVSGTSAHQVLVEPPSDLYEHCSPETYFETDTRLFVYYLVAYLSGGSFRKLLLMFVPLPDFPPPPPPEIIVGVELDDDDDKFGQPTADPAFGDGVRDAFGSFPDDAGWPTPPTLPRVPLAGEFSADSAISAAAVAAISSSCRFFSYSVCLPCCISSFVKLAASSPGDKKIFQSNKLFFVTSQHRASGCSLE